MQHLRLLVLLSVLAGVIVGTATTVFQYVSVTPLILQAEVFEQAGEAESIAVIVEEQSGTAAAIHTDATGHVHDEEAWGPTDGLQRNLFSWLANVLTATGFAFILTGLMSLKTNPIGYTEGLLWGLAGFVTVTLAPGIGLPPELPGTPAADLNARQLWWSYTVIATGGGLALINYKRQTWAFALAAALIVSPHLIGAPHPSHGEVGLAPAALESKFIVMATLMSLVSWVLLGPLCQIFLNRFRTFTD